MQEPLDTVSLSWSNRRMQTGAQQLEDWMKRRGLNAVETARHLGWDHTFVSKLVNGHRAPGLVNALILERETGIPVEAWVSSELDKPELTVVGNNRKRK